MNDNSSPIPVRHPVTVNDVRYAVVSSRRLLIDTIRGLNEFDGALTVVGAHAVHFWVQDAWGPVEMQATRDADLAVNPAFVSPDPKLLDLLSGLGVARALRDRPGIYGYEIEDGLPLAERTTIDLIVPEVYAGHGRRAARIVGQDSAASRARGLELAVWDRHRQTLVSLEESSERVEAWIAGPAALLVAKSHKVHERLGQAHIHVDRLRPKDSGDVALLMMVSNPIDVATTLAEHSQAHPEIAQAVGEAADWLVEMYSDKRGLVRRHMVDALADRIEEDEINQAVDGWLGDFMPAYASASPR